MKHNVLLAIRQTNLTEYEDKRTVWLMGKPYHWTLDDEQLLSLQPGLTSFEEVRAHVVRTLLDKGMAVGDITPEMIEDVITRAELAALTEQEKSNE